MLTRTKPKALDLFCCAGGASMGLWQAGFEVFGVDIEPQPRYPFAFAQADALTYPLEGFDFIWASPPCQQFCALRTREDLSGYPDLIEPIRARLTANGVPFVIENVPGAPVRHDLMLCGAMFGLRSYRHRFLSAVSLSRSPNTRNIWLGSIVAVKTGASIGLTAAS